MQSSAFDCKSECRSFRLVEGVGFPVDLYQHIADIQLFQGADADDLQPCRAHSPHEGRSYEPHPFALAAQIPVRSLMQAATLQAPPAQTPEVVLSTDTEQQIHEQSAQETDNSSSHATVGLPHALFNLIKRLGKQGKQSQTQASVTYYSSPLLYLLTADGWLICIQAR